MKSILPVFLIVLISFGSCSAEKKGSDSQTLQGSEVQQDEGKSQIAKNISPDEFEKGLSAPGAILLDVRTPEEYQEGHIANSKSINFYDKDFADQVKNLDKNTPVYVYCRSGGRSASAMAMLSEQGIREVYNLEGGIIAWGRAKKEIVR